MHVDSSRWFAFSRLTALSLLALTTLAPTIHHAQDPTPPRESPKPVRRVADAPPEQAPRSPAPAPQHEDDGGSADDDEQPEAGAEEPEAVVAENTSQQQEETHRHHVVALRGNTLVLDLTREEAKPGDVVEVWRTLRATHPITGAMLVDQIRVGNVRITQVGDQLALGEPSSDVGEFVAGDWLVVAQPEAPAPKNDGVLTSSAESAALNALWSSLPGASLRKRLLTFEAFVRKYPSSPYAVALWEEARSLRELMAGRVDVDLPPAPERPVGALGLVASGHPAGASDTVTVDFDSLEERYRQRESALGGTGLRPPVEAPDEKKPGVHLHDGTFVRLAFGPAWFNATYDGNFRRDALAPNVRSQIDLSDAALTAEVVAGGSPVPGFVLAARMAFIVAPGADAQFSALGDGSSDTTLDATSVFFFGGAVDVYPDPELGIHFFGNVGMSQADLSGDDRVGDVGFLGVGYGGGFGFEGFVSDQWSIGVQGRVDAAYMISTSDVTNIEEEVLTMVAPTLQVAFTYH